MVTASDLSLPLFRFRRPASSSGHAALLAKPRCNRINLLCVLGGHPVTLSSFEHAAPATRTDTNGEYKITSTEVSFVGFEPLYN